MYYVLHIAAKVRHKNITKYKLNDVYYLPGVTNAFGLGGETRDVMSVL